MIMERSRLKSGIFIRLAIPVLNLYKFVTLVKNFYLRYFLENSQLQKSKILYKLIREMVQILIFSSHWHYEIFRDFATINFSHKIILITYEFQEFRISKIPKILCLTKWE